MDVEKIEKDKFLASMKKKHERGNVDSEALKAKDQTMKDILGDIVQMPSKIAMVGPVGKTSVRKTKKDENDLHGEDGEVMVKEQDLMD